MVFILGRVVNSGYNVVDSYYHGNDGGEGIEEFGCEDVNGFYIKINPFFSSR